MTYNWSNEIKNIINSKFLEALKEANLAIENFGSTSSKKVTPIHKWMAESIELILGVDFIAFADTHKKFITKDGRKLVEPKVLGKYFSKNIDVGVAHKDTPQKIEAVIEIKYYSGNLSQNENNNIENMLGYTANVRGNNMLFGNFIVAKQKTPYYDKEGKLIKFEDHSISKWIKYENILKEPKSSLHRPDAISITLTTDGTEVEMEKYKGTTEKIKGSEIRKKMLTTAEPQFVSSPNITSDYLDFGPAHFVNSFAIKIMAHHKDSY